ncbi:hypothetical protein ASG41_21500 [Modestobacter sp. Leaf380]|nr:hypothetical protein ASG41_21500 [Modestobacter sp. Leaf380]
MAGVARSRYDTRDTDAWAAEDLAAAEGLIAAGPVFGDWPGPGPAVLDVRHEATGTFLGTRTVLTRVHLPDEPAPSAEEAPMPPMGCTSLVRDEKRAVVVDGAVARLWARGADGEPCWWPGSPEAFDWH